jgi:DNA-binding MarR family transcriptional regulator
VQASLNLQDFHSFSILVGMASSAPDRAEAIDLVANSLLGRAARLTRLLMPSGAHKLSRTEVGVLATLSEGSRRITQLAQTEALAQPTVTQLVDKLEGRGLVARARFGEDARVVMVEVTPTGTEVFEEVRAEIRENMREALADLPDDELIELAHASETLGGLIETLLPRDA